MILLACAAAVGVMAGCGESDQEQAREVAQDYVDAQNAEDYDRICDLYSDRLKRDLAIEDNCPDFVQEASGGGDGEQEFRLVSVRVRDNRATADLDIEREQEGPVRVGIILEREDGDWRIVALQ